MPRVPKAKTSWRAGVWVPDVALSKPQIAALCEAAGLDVQDGDHREPIAQMRRGVSAAVALYRAERQSHQDAPRPVHQRVALESLRDRTDATIEAFNELDDASRERLSARRQIPRSFPPRISPKLVARYRQLDKADPKFHSGMEPRQALGHLRDWSGAVTLALRDLDGAESRGRTANSARMLLLTLLTDVFVDVADDGDLGEFIAVGCKVAGVQLSTRQAQEQAKQLLPENLP